ncbi:HNH endonuclease [Serratia rubidaea]|uniref:HNH endonuclease n=1 Tax=Serratia rubidaea TaxID=61652 RepID=UPI003FA38AE4
MKMTRLEAIREWGKASREGRTIPEHVKAVLLATQSDRDQTPLIVPAKPLAASFADTQPKRKFKLSKKAEKTSYLSDIGIGGAITAEQMEAYNKRKSNNKKRKINSSTHVYLISEPLVPEVSKRHINRKENNKAERKHKVKSKRSARALIQKERNKLDPWYVAKVKQDAISKAKEGEKEFERRLSLCPVGCIECKKTFKSFYAFVDHIGRMHNESISTPKLVEVQSSVETPPVVTEDAVDSRSDPITSSESISAAPMEKEYENFIDRWIRIFSEKGYSFPVVDAFKREAGKQRMDAKQIREFLDVCKPNKKSIPAIESVERIKNASGIVNSVKAPVPSIVPLSSVAKCVRGEKVEINTVGRDTGDQAMFRKAIGENYSYRCCITDDSIAIEAAHIQTHDDYYDNSVDNGIMLSVGLHRLFDKGIMIIDPESMTIHFTVDCFYKKHLEGAVVKQGKVKISKDKLYAKNQNHD